MAEQTFNESSTGSANAAGAVHRSRLKLYFVIAICAAPVLASYYAYYFVRPEARSNYGELIDPQRPMPALHLKTLDGQPFDNASLRGKWVLLMVADGSCDASCTDRLYHMRQVRLTTGKDRDRVERVWLVPDASPLPARVVREYDGTRMLRADAAEVAAWLAVAPSTAREDRLYVMDPLGNLMMRFPVDADPSRTKRDLAKLLRASRIG